MTLAAPTQSGPTVMKYGIINPIAPCPTVTELTFSFPWANRLGVLEESEVRGDIFCSHHVWTRDGNLFIAGGTVYRHDSQAAGNRINGSKLVYSWDPSEWNQTGKGWHKQVDELAQGRYYPTVTQGPAGGQADAYFITGGLEDWSQYPEMGVPEPSFPDTYSDLQ